MRYRQLRSHIGKRIGELIKNRAGHIRVVLKNVLLPRRKFPSLKQIIAGNIKCEELCVRDIRQVKTNFGRETTSGVFNKLNICGRHILEPRIWSGLERLQRTSQQRNIFGADIEFEMHTRAWPSRCGTPRRC